MATTKKSTSARVPATRISTKKDDQTHVKPVVGFIGLGIMGSAMASNLNQAGFHVYGFDPSPHQLQDGFNYIFLAQATWLLLKGFQVYMA